MQPPSYENPSGLLKSLPTKQTPVAKVPLPPTPLAVCTVTRTALLTATPTPQVQFSSRNILLAGGAFQLGALG